MKNKHTFWYISEFLNPCLAMRPHLSFFDADNTISMSANRARPFNALRQTLLSPCT